MSEVTGVAPPAPGARDQVARLLRLVPFLHARGQVRLEDAAAALDTSPAQLVRDLKVLLMCGLPGGYPDDLIDVDLDALEEPGGDGVIRVSNADYLARPLRLTPTEASAVIVALRALRSGSGPESREVVDRALAKLEMAAADGATMPLIDPGESAQDLPAQADVAELADRLQRASDSGLQVRLHYWVPARDEESMRVVDPRGVVTAHGVAYLDAWCHTAEAPRLFRLDRVGSAQVLEDPVTSAPEAPRDLTDGVLSGSDGLTRVTLRLRPAAAWVTEYYPVLDVRPVPGAPPGTVEVDLDIADERWLTKLILRLAPNAQVVEPPGFADAVIAAARRTARLYD